MNTTELNWRTWMKYGDQYLKAAVPRNKTRSFNTDI